MKKKHKWLFGVAATFIFLLLLLVLQIRWLIETAETEKMHFEQGVKLSIDLTMQQIINDPKLCNNIQTCLLDTMCLKIKALRKIEWQKIDSIIKRNLNNYGINCEYNFDLKFEIASQPQQLADSTQNVSPERLLLDYHSGNLQLIVDMPDKNSFIKKRIGPIFIGSILLIVLIAFSFVFLVWLYFKNEKNYLYFKRFLHNMSHEFKTPVSVIGLANSGIKRFIEHSGEKKLLKYTEIIDNENKKIEEQLTAILDLAYFESDKARLVIKPERANELVEAAILNIKPILEDKNGKINWDPMHTDLLVDCSKCHIVNALTNILDNACKYSAMFPEISVVTLVEKDSLIIDILDNGIGILKKDIPYIFEKYYRVGNGNIHNTKGYGIGLSYVQEVLRLHGGKVEVESEFGKGSRFRILLPKTAKT
jgi:two-component system, OmpR family, phosphate regulon sensor histidine kinase PhoR